MWTYILGGLSQGIIDNWHWLWSIYTKYASSIVGWRTFLIISVCGELRVPKVTWSQELKGNSLGTSSSQWEDEKTNGGAYLKAQGVGYTVTKPGQNHGQTHFLKANFHDYSDLFFLFSVTATYLLLNEKLKLKKKKRGKQKGRRKGKGKRQEMGAQGKMGGERKNIRRESQIFKRDLGILRYAKAQTHIIHPIKSHGICFLLNLPL